MTTVVRTTEKLSLIHFFILAVHNFGELLSGWTLYLMRTLVRSCHIDCHGING